MLTRLFALLIASCLAPQKGEAVRSPVYDGFRPEDGLWYDASRPGSGLTLDYQESFSSERTFGGLLTVALYTYREDGSPFWALASGPIDPETLTFEADLDEFSGGSCLVCEPFSEPQVDFTRTIKIRFVGPNRAFLSIDDSPERAIRTFLFGVSWYIWGQRDEFRGGALPSLLGRWVFVDAQTGEQLASVNFTGLVRAEPPPAYTFDEFPRNDDAEWSMRCGDVGTGRFPDNVRLPACSLYLSELIDGDWVRGEPVMTVHPGDMGPDRMLGYRGGPVPADSATGRGARPVWGFRLPHLLDEVPEQ